MSAKRSERPTGCGRATVLIAVLICRCSLSAITREYGLLRLEGLMVLTGLNDGKVRKLGSPSEALILEDHVTWRLGVDKEMSLFRFPLAKLHQRALRFQFAIIFSILYWEREPKNLLVIELCEGTALVIIVEALKTPSTASEGQDSKPRFISPKPWEIANI